MSQTLEVNREGRLLRLTLSNIEKRNALSLALCQALVDEVDGAQNDTSVGAILIDGTRA